MKKEIIVFTQHLGNGGAERVLSELMTEWVRLGYVVYALLTKSNRYGNNYNLDNKINIISIDKYSKLPKILEYIFQIPKYIKFLKKHRNAVVISFLTPCIIISAVVSFFVNNKFIFSERCDPERSPKGFFYRFLRDISFFKANISVFQTNMSKKHFHEYIQKHSIIIPNPINPKLPDRFKGVRRKAIVAVSQLIEQKNIPMLIEAFEKFSQKHSDYVLEIYGKGYLENYLKSLVKKKNMMNKIYFMGFCEDIFNKIVDASMYVSSSNFEGISNSMLEALGMGIPTICTDCPAGGAKDNIIDGFNGFLIPVGDVETLTFTMNKIAENDYLKNKLSENSCEIREKLNINIIANKWLEIM